MLFRFTAPVALFVALAGLAGCSGGSATVGAANQSCATGNAKALCLFNCSLGCSTTGCLRTDIAQNEILILQFTDDIDPASVSSSSVRLRTAAGELPVGEFFVNGDQIEFVPTLLVSGGQTFFGFKPGDTYTLTLPGGANETDVLRSTSGYAFEKTYSCTLVTSQGIRDLNGVPPEATLVSPTTAQLNGAPLETVIQLDFNEMVDITPFQNGSPVTFSVRRTIPGPSGRECNPASDPIPLPGTPRLVFDPSRRISVLTFQAAQPLPPNVCIEINVTSAVVDLSGKPAQPQAFQFTTLELPLMEQEVVEEFDNNDQLDIDRSAADWSNGVATFRDIGGDGSHGDFSVEFGTYKGLIGGKDVWEFDTDATTIPAENTFTNSPFGVTDGKFYFDSMVVPGTVRLTFVGSTPPVFTVAGKLDVLGEIDVRGETLAFPSSQTASLGQTGGKGGVFGGDGGDGANKANGAGAQLQYQGKDGQSAHVLAGRAYSSTTSGTAGKGSTQFPADGLTSSIYFGSSGPGVFYSPTASAPGGGGGLWTAGEPGEVTYNNHPDPSNNMPPRLDQMGPPAAGGTAVQFFPFPASTGSNKSSVHFLVGGSGGGSSASNAALTLSVAAGWAAGAGGGGGGGAVGLRAGDSLTIGAIGKVLASGGSTGGILSYFGVAAAMPGGAGSGGTVLLQTGRDANLAGQIDVLGGDGGTYERQAGGNPPVGARVEAHAGNGSDGFIRFEMPGSPTTLMLPNTLPAAQPDNVAALTEQDRYVSFRTLWYSTGQVFGPEFARYEIHATVDGQSVIYSDDTTVSPVMAGVGSALRLWIQNGQMDLATGDVTEIQPWRTGVATFQGQIGISTDGRNAFRYAVIQDRDVAATVTIEKIVIVFKV